MKIYRSKIYDIDIEDINVKLLIDLDELHPNWEKVVKAVESGNFTIEQIKKRYNMSEEIEEKLLSLQKK